MDLDERLQTLFREFFDDDSLVLTDDTTAADIPDWDSLQHVTLIYLLEDEFGITFNGDEAAALANIGELKALLRAKLNR